MKKNLLPGFSSIVIGRHKRQQSNDAPPEIDENTRLILSQIQVKEAPKDPLSLLPTQLLHNILLYLENVKFVITCRLVNTVMFKAFDENFWQKMCFHSYFLNIKLKPTWYETFVCIPPAITPDFINKYELLNVLGGKWAKVLEVRNKETKHIYGLKIYKVDSAKINRNSTRFYKYLNNFIHPFMVRIHEFGLSEDSGKLYLVIDYVSQDLSTLYTLNELCFAKKTVQFVVAQVILVAEFMHSKGDLFKCSSTDKIRVTSSGYVKFNWISKEIIGTPLSHRISIIDAFEYSAPEFVEGGEFRLSCVFWGLGCLIYQLIGGQPLLQNTATNLIKLAREIFTLELTFSNLFDADSKDLLRKLLEKDPTERLGRFDLLRSHPFFECIDWHALLNMQLPPPEQLWDGVFTER